MANRTVSRKSNAGEHQTVVVDANGGQLFELRAGDVLQGVARPQREAVFDGIRVYGEALAANVNVVDSLDPELLETAITASANTFELMLRTVEHSQQILELPKTRRQPLGRGLERVAELLVESAHQTQVSTKELQAQVQVAIDTLTVLIRGGSAQLRSVIDALEPVAVDDPAYVDLEEAEARGRLRLHALYQKLIRESYSVAELREQGLSRQRLKQLRDEERLFAVDVPYHKGLLYPIWQFDSTSGRARSMMPTLIAVAKEAGLDAIGLHQTMTNPAAGNGTPPFRLLDEGHVELVLGILKSADQ